MGKRQHQKDKMYLTYTEWSTLYGGRKSGTSLDHHEDSTFKRLPFNHCCVSLKPFQHPYCDQHGNVFELEAVFEYIKHFKHNPVTGHPLERKGLIKLTFFKNADKQYHCPVLFKVFTKHSHIIAIKTTGNVFSHEAVEQLNIKTRNMKDLINDVLFTKDDIITIQDPNDARKFNLSSFHHIKNNLKLKKDDTHEQKSNSSFRLKTVSTETRDILNQLDREYQHTEKTKVVKKTKLDKFNSAHYSTGAVAAGLTSTVMPIATIIEPDVIAEDLIRYERIWKKGYLKLITNFGPLNLELNCDIVPKTCENFMKHCQNGYYNGTKFHRSIRNFMVQGGDPTNTGNNGESIWGKPFEDEFKPNLVHYGRGILSMANSGPNTNGSQFFITYRSCRHLDRKHTVFGRIVGGLDTLNEIEKIEVDNKDRPIEDIVIQGTEVFVDPYTEADEQLATDRGIELQSSTKKNNQYLSKPKNQEVRQLKIYRQGVAKYINMSNNEDSSKREELSPGIPAKKQKILCSTFNNFSSW